MIDERTKKRVLNCFKLQTDRQRIRALNKCCEELNELSATLNKGLATDIFNDDELVMEIGDVIITMTAMIKVLNIHTCDVLTHIISKCEEYEGISNE